MTKKWAPINAPGVGASAPSADGDEIDAPSTPTRRTRTTATATAGGKPSTVTARAMTVRMDPDEADEVDQFVLDLRAEAGRHFDKADLVRELIRLAREDTAVRRKLAKRL